MIDFNRAEKLIQEHVPLLEQEKIALRDSNGRILAANIYASIDHPFFDQSAVDGYLINYAEKSQELKVVDEVSAGTYSSKTLQGGEAIRIFTGAPIPKGGDTVVLQEYVIALEKDGHQYLQISDQNLVIGGNIRRKGGQLKKGELTLKKGDQITSSGIGFLASIGIQEVSVYKQPNIGIVVTGNEFVSPNEVLKGGKIYESNGIMLQAALQKNNIQCNCATAIDELPVLSSVIKNRVSSLDVLIITGGVSVGDYDFTKPALIENGFKEVFHKVKQKPGKPFLFMKREDDKIAFGLPGNPRSAIMTFYMYILPAIYKMMGSTQHHTITFELPLGHDYSKKEDGKTHFKTAIIENGQLHINKQQASHMMLSMATATAVAILSNHKLDYKKGDLVSCRFID